MKIALIHSFYRTSQPSGENNLVVAQITALEGMGHEVVVISRASPERSLFSQFGIRASLRVMSGLDRDIEKELEHQSADAIFLHNLFPNFGWRWVEQYREITTAFVHNYRFNCAAGNYFRSGHICTDCLRSSRFRAIRHRCYRNSALATIPLTAVTSSTFEKHPVYSQITQFVVGSKLGKEMLTRWGTPAEWIHVIPNFIPEQNPIPASNSRLPWACAGRLVPEKGIAELIRDFPHNRQLQVFGSGNLHDEIAHAATSNVTLHPNLSNADLQLRMRQTSGVIVPSRWFEVNPVVAAEAFSRGQPVIAFIANAVGRELHDIDNRLVYGTAQELLDSIRFVELEYARVQEVVRDHYRVHYSQESWFRSINALLA